MVKNGDPNNPSYMPSKIIKGPFDFPIYPSLLGTPNIDNKGGKDVMYDPINIYLATKVMKWEQVSGLKVWATGEKDHNGKTEMVSFWEWNPMKKEDQAFKALSQFLDNCGFLVSYRLENTTYLQHCCSLIQKENVIIKITETQAASAICKAIYETLKNWENRD